MLLIIGQVVPKKVYVTLEPVAKGVTITVEPNYEIKPIEFALKKLGIDISTEPKKLLILDSAPNRKNLEEKSFSKKFKQQYRYAEGEFLYDVIEHTAKKGLKNKKGEEFAFTK